MTSEIIQFLTTKFTSALHEVEKSHNQLPLINSFKDIRDVLEKRLSLYVPNQTRDTLMDCLYKLNDAFTECRMISESRRKRSLAPYFPRELYLLGRIRRHLAKVKQHLHSIADACTPSSSTVIGPLADQQISVVLGTHSVYGFHKQTEAIVASLQQECSGGINRIGIAGMGGVGKTTLAQEVYNHHIVKKNFIPRIWVTLSNKFDSRSDITKSIAAYLLKELGEGDDDDNDWSSDNVDLDHEDGSGREETEELGNNTSIDNLLLALHKQLSGKKYLIVFDDVWESDNWYKKLVGSELSQKDECGEPRGLPKGYGGGVMVTSRVREEVEVMVGEPNLYQLWPELAPQDCWSIFEDAVKMNGISPDQPILANMKMEIIENCNGLPLAAKTLGDIFSRSIYDMFAEQNNNLPHLFPMKQP